MIRALAITAALTAGCISDVAIAQAPTVPSQCAALEAEVNLLSSRFSERNEELQAEAAAMVAAQAAHANAAKAQRRSGATGNVIAGLIGSIVPGSEIVTGAASAAIRGATPRTPAPAPDAASRMTSTLVEQGNAAVRIGALLQQRIAAGCP